MDSKKSFLLYCDYKQHIDILSLEEKGELFEAIFDYACEGKTEELTGAVKMAFSFIKAQFDRDNEKWEQTKVKRAEAGKKGGRGNKKENENSKNKNVFKDDEIVKQTENNESREKQNKTNKANAFFAKQTETKKADTVNVKDNINTLSEILLSQNPAVPSAPLCGSLSGKPDSVPEHTEAKQVEEEQENTLDEKAEKKPKYAQICRDVIDYLNLKTGKRFRADIDKTNRFILSRLKEGFKYADFCAVIDKKCAQWANTEMDKFLRPETLFGTKFEGYLNELEAVTKKTSYNKRNNRFLDYDQADYDYDKLEMLTIQKLNGIEG